MHYSTLIRFNESILRRIQYRYALFTVCPLKASPMLTHIRLSSFIPCHHPDPENILINRLIPIGNFSNKMKPNSSAFDLTFK